MPSLRGGKSAKNAKDLPVSSTLRITCFSFIASLSVSAFSLLIQWFVYYDWLHRTGPVRFIGTTLAAVLTFGFVLRWQVANRDRQFRMLQRFETIARMNDRVRNSLQTIECVTYLSRPESTEPVREAVEVIDGVLQEVLADAWFEDRKTTLSGPYKSEKAKKQSA